MSQPLHHSGEASTIIYLSDLSKHLPTKPCIRTLQRWAKRGAKSVSGKQVRLKTVHLPNGKGSSMLFYSQFIDELQT